MSGINQELPSGATGPAVGVFIYSSICFSLSTALLWATIAHREWKSYVALLAFYTSLSTLASMSQQLHTYLRWSSIKLAQFDYVKARVGNPELSVAGPSVGIDLVFFYIQYYCYNAEAMLVVAWCTQLAHSIYHLKPSVSASRYGSPVAKVAAILVPILQVSLMRASVVQNDPVAFYFLANFIMGVSLALGIVLLLAILAKYVSTRTETSWHVRYADRSTAIDEAYPEINSLASFTSHAGVPLHHKSIYDNWLVVRFTVAFAGLAAFQLITIMSEISNALDNDDTLADKNVDLHVSRAISDIQAFVPGVSASILAFVVFGTTKAFREYFYRKFVPRPIRRKLRRRSAKGASIISAPARAASQRLRRPPRSDSTMYPPAPVATTRPFGPGWYQPSSPSPRVECFEMDGGESGMGHGTREVAGIHELPMPTPTYSTFEGQGQGGMDDDQRPILNSKPLR